MRTVAEFRQWPARFRPFPVGLMALSGVLLAACGSPGDGAGPLPDVVLVTVDTLRADRVGAYGYRLDTTPNIDALARRGVVFTDCTVAWPKTWPSLAALLTGLPPQRNGVTYALQHLDASRDTLAEIFGRAGYVTAAVVANFNVGAHFGFDQGFSHFVESWQRRWNESGHAGAFRDPMRVKDYTNATLVTDEALRLLAAPREAPLFLWLHYIDPHGPYQPPAAYRSLFRGAHARQPVPAKALPPYQLQHDPETGAPIADLGHYRGQYDREIRYLDDELGRLFAALEGDRAKTLVVLTADHGESLGEHGYLLEHGRYSYQVSARVPLIVSRPGVLPEGLRVEAPVGVIDLAPTLLELAGLEVPAAFEGVSLAGLVRGDPQAAAPEHVFMASGYVPDQPQLTIRSGRWKLIDVPARRDRAGMTGARTELYDLTADPAERHNLAAGQADLVAQLESRLRGWYGDGMPQRAQGGETEVPLDAHEREMLRQLGYADGDDPESP